MIGSAPPTRVVAPPLERVSYWMVAMGILGTVLGGLTGSVLSAGIGFKLCLVGLFLMPLYNWLRGRNERDDRAVIAAQLSALLELKIPLDQALRVLSADGGRSITTSLSRPYAALCIVADEVACGAPLGRAIETTDAFGPLWPALLTPNDENLAATLRRISRAESDSLELPASLAVRYFLQFPLILGVVFFLRSYILPTFLQIFEGMDWRLPLATVAIISLKSWIEVPLGLLSMLIFGSLIRPVRAWMWRLLTRLPGVWAITKLSEQARFCQAAAAASLLGLSSDRVLACACAATRHPVYRQIRFGPSDSLASALRARPDLFETRLVWLVEQGERHQNVPEAFELAASFMQDEFDAGQRRLVHQLDTALLLMLGLLTCMVSVGLMTPIMQLNQAPLEGLW
ncbi:MAG: hypothetical protein AMXMBFR33_05070 [Candidatus Xenobia bacterium]